MQRTMDSAEFPSPSTAVESSRDVMGKHMRQRTVLIQSAFQSLKGSYTSTDFRGNPDNVCRIRRFVDSPARRAGSTEEALRESFAKSGNAATLKFYESLQAGPGAGRKDGGAETLTLGNARAVREELLGSTPLANSSIQSPFRVPGGIGGAKVCVCV